MCSRRLIALAVLTLAACVAPEPEPVVQPPDGGPEETSTYAWLGGWRIALDCQDPAPDRTLYLEIHLDEADPTELEVTAELDGVTFYDRCNYAIVSDEAISVACAIYSGGSGTLALDLTDDGTTGGQTVRALDNRLPDIGCRLAAHPEATRRSRP